MENEYLVSLVFFVESDNIARKDRLVSRLNSFNYVDIIDIYDDGEDWNIECEVRIKCNNPDAIHTKLILKLPNNTWDYHYIKGVDNDYYWQP